MLINLSTLFSIGDENRDQNRKGQNKHGWLQGHPATLESPHNSREVFNGEHILLGFIEDFELYLLLDWDLETAER